MPVRTRTPVDPEFFYRSELHLVGWATKHLGEYLSPEEFPLVFKALQERQLERIDLAVLHYLLAGERPARAIKTKLVEDLSTSVTAREVASRVGSSPGGVRRSILRVNKLAVRGVEVGVEPRVVFIFHDRGFCGRRNLTPDDAKRARSYSEKQLHSQAEVHLRNLEEAKLLLKEIGATHDRLMRFYKLTPAQQERALKSVT